MSYKQLDYSTVELLKSLSDGFDLESSAAEYIIAWNSMESTPADIMYKSLKITAEQIILAKEASDDESKTKVKVKYDKGTDMGPGYLLSTHNTQGEPTNHLWENGLQRSTELSNHFSLWPTYIPESPHVPYREHHFPFHQVNHPLRRVHAVSGMPHFVEMIKSHVLGTAGEEEKDFEKDFEKELLPKNSPLLFGYKGQDKDAKPVHILGPLRTNGTVHQHQMDLYERDFQRWHGNNRDIVDELAKSGLKGKELREAIKHEHFNSRSKEWVSDEEVLDENYDAHPVKLGHQGYMYGLEWFSPEERTAIRKHIDEKGLRDKHTITLPNGEKIPSARITYNALYRQTPEMNWFVRNPLMTGRNAPMRQENNDTDYSASETGRFLQSGIGNLVHSGFRGESENSIASYILDELNDLYNDERVKAGQKRLKYLPRLNLHSDNEMKDMEWSDLKSGERAQFGKRKFSPETSRASIEDVLYLAGFHPKTREPLVEHPIYGTMEGPIVPLDWIEEMEKDAKHYGSIHQRAKEIRTDRGFLTSVYGPHPDEDASPYWKLSKDGKYRYGPQKFWAQPFQSLGGIGSTLSTYHDILHSLSSNEDDISPLTEIDETGESYFKLNEKNSPLALHFMPEQTQIIAEKSSVLDGLKKVNSPTLVQNLLSPVNASRVTPSEQSGTGYNEGITDKNNHTEHKSSLSPQYEYAIRHLTHKERQNQFGTSNMPMHKVFSKNPFGVNSSKRAYSPHVSDTHIHDNAKAQYTAGFLLGRTEHPNTPAEKSVLSVKDYLRNEHPYIGDDKNSLAAFMGWGVNANSFDKIKNRYLTHKKDRLPLSYITKIAKMLNTTSPHTILQYIEEGDHNELKSYLGLHANESIDFNSIHTFLKDMEDTLDKQNENIKGKTQKATATDAIQFALGFGGMLPAMEEEEKLNTAADQILNEINLADSSGEYSPQRKQELREELREVQSQINTVQQRAIDKLSKKPGSQWTIDENFKNKLLVSHRNTVANVATHLKEKMLEADPDAFNPDNPQLFIANNCRLFRDAQRYILSVEHKNHGLSSAGYDIGYQIKETKKIPSGGFHAKAAKHLHENGSIIDGTMSVDEVIEMLNLEKTPAMKEHVSELIKRSNNLNTPLHASTVSQLLTHGGMSDIGGLDISHLHEDLSETDESELNDTLKFTKLIQEKGFKRAITIGQKETSKPSTWKAHQGHSLPRRVKMLLRPQENQVGLLTNGLESISNDVNGLAESQKGQGGKGKATVSAGTKNTLDTIIHFNPTSLDDEIKPFQTPDTEIVGHAGLQDKVPIGAPNPNNSSIYDTFDAGALHMGYEMSPSVGLEFTSDGKVHAGTNVDTGMYHSVPLELSRIVHGKDMVKQVWDNAPPPQYQNPPYLSINTDTYEAPSDQYTSIALSEMGEYIESLINPDVLLMKSEDAKWIPMVRPMHRIFEMSDLEHLRGFSGSWVVSKWYDGKRVLVVKSGDDITAYDENGRKVGLRKSIKESVDKLTDNNFAIDALLSKEELNIIDIVNYDDNDISDMQLYERIKTLRSQFDSHENVIIPGPHDTKMTDDEGLEDAVKVLQEEHTNVLLRDSKSTYMKGERRHPKWIIYRSTRDFNFIVLDRRGKGPYTYQLGAGPLIDGDDLGNRAIEYKGRYYMDVGTARNQQKAFKEGEIIRVSISGVTKKTRGERNIYTVQVKEVEGLGEGEGAASTESLDLLTKSFSPIIIPHNLEYNETKLQILLKDVDTVTYQVEQLNDSWYIHSPKASMGVLSKSRYAINLAESLLPYWGAVAPLMIKGDLVKLEEEPEEEPEESAGILEEDDEERLLKPNTKKAFEIIIRALDAISKEKLTWTGPRGLGIDMATPDESPSGPTRLTEEKNLPDDDMVDRNGEKGPSLINSSEKKSKHLKPLSIDTDAEEHLVLEEKDGTPTLSVL